MEGDISNLRVTNARTENAGDHQGVYIISGGDVHFNDLIMEEGRVRCEAGPLYISDSELNGATAIEARADNITITNTDVNGHIDLYADGTTIRDSNLEGGDISPQDNSYSFRVVNSAGVSIYGNNPPDKGFFRNNTGFVNENSGTATIPSGNTSVTVSHGIGGPNYSLTLEDGDISLTPLDNIAGRSIWVSGANSDNFTINISDTLASDVDIAWVAEEHYGDLRG